MTSDTGTTQMRSGATVAHVVLSLQPGGLERLVCDLSVATARMGARVFVYCLDEKGRLAPALESEGIAVKLVGRRAGLGLGLIPRLRRLLLADKIDVLHTHGVDPMLYAGWAARLAGTPVRVHTQHDTMLETKGWRHRLKFRLAGPAFHSVVAVSRMTEQIVARHYRGRGLRTIANGIDVERFRVRTGAEDGERRTAGAGLVIGTVARLAPEKAIDSLIDAFSTVQRAIPNCRLVIVGDGPERESLHARVRELRLESRVEFAGHQQSVERFVRDFDLFVLPSRTEGIPLAMLEAMATGIPVVATAVGGVPEVIVNGESGVLVAPNDSLALSAALIRVLSDPTLRARLGESGAKQVRGSFSLASMAARYRALYHQDRVRGWAAAVRSALMRVTPRAMMTWRGPVSRHEVALTLDDGPDPEFTPKLLEILKRHDVRATFFLIGEKVDRHDGLVRRIVNDGHQIANHSYSHPHFGALTLREARSEIERGRRAVERAHSSAAGRLFRPPRGTLCTASTVLAWLTGSTVVLWSVDYKDFRAETADDITRVAANGRLVAGDIILYHGHNQAALEALPEVLQAARREGLTFVPVSRMCWA
ncbi:MAG TPA: glycosyltransferase [Vicinamibacterales bacterium]